MRKGGCEQMDAVHETGYASPHSYSSFMTVVGTLVREGHAHAPCCTPIDSLPGSRNATYAEGPMYSRSVAFAAREDQPELVVRDGVVLDWLILFRATLAGASSCMSAVTCNSSGSMAPWWVRWRA